MFLTKQTLTLWKYSSYVIRIFDQEGDNQVTFLAWEAINFFKEIMNPVKIQKFG